MRVALAGRTAGGGAGASGAGFAAGLHRAAGAGAAGRRRPGPAERPAPGGADRTAGHRRSEDRRCAVAGSPRLPGHRQGAGLHQPADLDRLQPRTVAQPGGGRRARQCRYPWGPTVQRRRHGGAAEPGADRHPLRRGQPQQAETGQHLVRPPRRQPLGARRAGQPRRHQGQCRRQRPGRHLRHRQLGIQPDLRRRQVAELHECPGGQRLRLYPGAPEPGGDERAERVVPRRRRVSDPGAERHQRQRHHRIQGVRHPPDPHPDGDEQPPHCSQGGAGGQRTGLQRRHPERRGGGAGTARPAHRHQRDAGRRRVS